MHWYLVAWLIELVPDGYLSVVLEILGLMGSAWVVCDTTTVVRP
jgi:hypothetical protein